MNRIMKRIAVVTSGGDVPGLNAAIRAVTRSALSMHLEVIGIKRGYAGMIEGDFVPFDSSSVGGILRRGGTILGSARCKEFETEAGLRKAADRLSNAGIDGVVIIGGNGSLRGALRLHELGVPLIGIPKTIDNDQFGTDIAIGVDTALNTIADAIGKIKDTASSHRRAFLIEVMGRHCGYLALASGIVGGAEVILIPEFPLTFEQVSSEIHRAHKMGKPHCIAVIAEGWQPGLLALKAYLKDHDSSEMESGYSVREVILGHVQRGGTPTAFDRLLASRMSVFAVEKLVSGEGNGMMVGLQKGRIELVALSEATSRDKPLDPQLLEVAKLLA
jgi:6-phosphofructokinase 1